MSHWYRKYNNNKIPVFNLRIRIQRFRERKREKWDGIYYQSIEKEMLYENETKEKTTDQSFWCFRFYSAKHGFALPKKKKKIVTESTST